MDVVPDPIVTPEAYLAAERGAAVRHELVNGRVYALSGASYAHALITASLVTALSARLAGTGCRAVASDLRVKVAPTGLYTYPDVVVVCGAPRFDDALRDTLLNPAILVEVLSPSTEAYDRGAKFAHYRRLGSLSAYVLLAQDQPRAERFLRQDQSWVLTELSGLEEMLTLPLVPRPIPLADLYDGVELPPGDTTRDPPSP